MTPTLYGIKNCDSVKKARRWLEDQGLDYRFHDFRADGLSAERLALWEAELGYATLLNTRGTTWRKLEAAQRENLDRERAVALMLAQPSLVKRPVLESGGKTLVGFSPDDYEKAL